jgi:hypothetical protein
MTQAELLAEDRRLNKQIAELQEKVYEIRRIRLGRDAAMLRREADKAIKQTEQGENRSD